MALIEALVETDLDFLHLSLRDFRQESLHQSFEGSTLAFISNVINDRKPLVAVGSVKTSEDANEIIEKYAPFVAIGRVGISDPEWPNHPDSARLKVPAGDFADLLTLPAGLAARIEATPGWFERD